MSEHMVALVEQMDKATLGLIRWSMNGSREAAEDLTSTVFLNVWQTLSHDVKRGAPFESSVLRIVGNCLIYYLRQQPPHLADSLDFATDVADHDRGNDCKQSPPDLGCHGADFERLLLRFWAPTPGHITVNRAVSSIVASLQRISVQIAVPYPSRDTLCNA